MDASNKQEGISEKFVRVWEKKNAKAARAGGVSLMALSLAACGSSSTTTTTSTDTTTTTTTTPAATSSALTVGVDTYTGTAGNDSISGARIDTVQTWTSADTLAGGAGTDTLTATIAAAVTPATGGITGVENLVITGKGAVTVDFSSATADFITGVTHITNMASDNTIAFNNVTGLAEVTVNNTATTDTTTVEFKDTVLAGAADTVTLNLIGAGAAVNIGSQTDADGDYETLIINASGAASDLEAGDGLGADSTTIDINATAALDLGSTAAFEKITSFDASDSTAGVTAVLGNKAAAGTTAVTIKGGAGNDSYDISAFTAANHGAVSVDMGAGNDTLTLGASGAGDFTIAGGVGTDTLSISGNPSTTKNASVSGFETLSVNTAIASGATNTIDMAVFTGNTTFDRINLVVTTAASEGATDEIITVSNAADAITTLGIGALDTDDIDVNFSRLVDGTANALTVASSTTSASETVAMNDEETITFNSADGSITMATLSATDMTSLVLTGDNTVDLGTITAASLATVDATGLAATANGNFVAVMSSSTVAMTVTSNAATTHTGILNITTGSGADTITGTNNADIIVSGDGADTVSGGAGIDKITGGDGADTLTGGEGADIISSGKGADTIVLTESTAAADDVIFGNEGIVTGGTDIAFGSLAGADTITGFAGSDELIFDVSAFGLGGQTEVKAAVGSLLVNSTEEIAIITGAGYASDEAVEDAVAGRVTSDGLDMVIVYFNNTTNTTRVIHDVDAGVDGTATTTLIATLSDYTTLTLHETLTVDNVNSFA